MTETLNLAVPLTLAGLTTAIILCRAALDLWRRGVTHRGDQPRPI